MTTIAWQFNNTQAVFIQIADRLRGEIVVGKYPHGAQMPAVRQLAFEASVNPNTMQRALSLLEEEGLLISRGTVGRFVTSEESVLEDAKKKIRLDMVGRFLSEAQALGISPSTLIDYIKEVGHE